MKIRVFLVYFVRSCSVKITEKQYNRCRTQISTDVSILFCKKKKIPVKTDKSFQRNGKKNSKIGFLTSVLNIF